MIKIHNKDQACYVMIDLYYHILTHLYWNNESFVMYVLNKRINDV